MLMSILLAAKSLPDLIPFTFLLTSAPSFFAVWMPFRMVSVVLPSRTYGRIDDFMWGTYQKLVLFFFEKMCPVEVLFYGDIESLLNSKESVLYISNHQSTVDWIVADMLAVRQGCIGNMRYILKDGLRFLPLYGYYFHQHDCVYVRRSRKFNSDIMKRNLEIIPRSRNQTWLIVFPEGTRYKPDNLEAVLSSKNFAVSNDLEPLTNVLVPRIKAFHLSLNSLRSYFTAVYDVTIIYSQTKRTDIDGNVARILAPSMNDYMHGMGEQLHIILNRIKIDDVPSDEQGVQRWLYSAFERKDRLLQEYYQTGTIPLQPQHIPLNWSSVLPATLFFVGLNTLLLGTSLGRKVYLTSVIAGSLLTVTWMGIRKVA